VGGLDPRKPHFRQLASYEVVLRALVDERQIVYMGFVLATRILVGIVIALGYKLIGGKSQQEFQI
jgi:hypothetical protein